MTWQSNRYNNSDMLRMQQEAIQRVQDMQERARRAAQGGGMRLPDTPAPMPQARPIQEPEPEPAPSPLPQAFPAPPEPAPGHHQHNPLSDLLSSFSGGDSSPLVRLLNGLGLDGEQLLILGLLFLLWNEEADHTIMLALLYLLF